MNKLERTYRNGQTGMDRVGWTDWDGQTGIDRLG